MQILTETRFKEVLAGFIELSWMLKQFWAKLKVLSQSWFSGLWKIREKPSEAACLLTASNTLEYIRQLEHT
jgi:hypothetical protein